MLKQSRALEAQKAETRRKRRKPEQTNCKQVEYPRKVSNSLPVNGIGVVQRSIGTSENSNEDTRVGLLSVPVQRTMFNTVILDIYLQSHCY